MGKISSYQLFTLTLCFQLGTTVIFGFASNAGRDAWISVILSAAIGTIIVILYTIIARLNPGLTLVECFPAQFGKWLGTPISWIYILMLLYEVGRLIVDVKDMLPPAILPNTPKILVSAIFLSVIAYVVLSGIEVLGRLGELIILLIFFSFILEIVLILGSGIVNLDRLLPIAGKGWGHILKAVWPLGITQTYGETFELAMIWPFVKDQNKIMKVSVLSCIISTVFIVALDFLAVAVLGEGTFSRSIYPFFKLVQQISIADFLKNLDALAVLFFLTTAFFKAAIKIFGAAYAVYKLTYAKNYKIFVIPFCIIILYMGMTMADNVPEHIDAGLKILPYNVWISTFLFMPGILLIVSLIRSKSSKLKRS